MFKSVIANTPLTTATANGYFDARIAGNPWSRDYSFLATLRALLGHRMPDKDDIYLSFGQSDYTDSQLRGLPVANAVSAVAGNIDNCRGSFRVHNFVNYNPICNTAWMELVNSSFESTMNGWHRVENVTLFFKKTFNVSCFVNPELKSVILFTDNMDIRKYHYLQAGIPAFLPWYFNQEDGVSELEMELLQSLREKTSQRYEECIAKMAEEYDFKSARIRQLLAGFETRYEKIKCDNLRTSLNSAIRNINELNDRIGDYLRQKRDYEAELLGLEMKIAQAGEESEIMEYFLCNEHLILVDVTQTRMTFIAKDYLTYFDEDMARRIINNNSSYVYIQGGGEYRSTISTADMKLLMTALFIEQSLKMKFCAAYTFNLEGNVTALGGYDYGSELREYMPNPHINRYTCIGNYSRAINNCLHDRNYIGALEQSIASCKSLNFGDSPVMREFMSQLYGCAGSPTNVKCIELPDGRVVAPKEAIEYLKSQTEEQNNG